MLHGLFEEEDVLQRAEGVKQLDPMRAFERGVLYVMLGLQFAQKKV